MFMRTCLLTIFSVMATMSGALAAFTIENPNVAPANNIKTGRWVDGNSNKWIKTPTDAQLKKFESTLGAGTTAASVTAGAPVTAPVSAPVTPPTPAPAGTSTPTPTPAPAPTTPSGAGTTTTKTTTPKTVTKSKLAGKMGKVGGAVSLVGGTMAVVDSASGDGPHSWGSVVEGAIGGAAAGAGAGALLNVIPGFGQVAYGITVAGATIVGGMVGGSQMFSETDCETDPALGLYTCCNTEFNKGQRFVGIGGEMFCKFPGVRQCLQGGSTIESDWFTGMFKDDAWGPCQEKYCSGIVAPDIGTDPLSILGVPFLDNETQQIACWNWTCNDGYKRVGNTCVAVMGADGLPTNPYDRVIQTIETQRKRIIAECGAYL